MTDLYSRKLLVESLGVHLTDFVCQACAHPAGPEEVNTTHSIVLVRRGAFGRVRGRERLVADANHVVFFNAGEPYRIFHPGHGGDDCTVLALPQALAQEAVARHAPRDGERPDAPFRFGHALSSTRTLRLHYELLAELRTPRLPLALDDVLAELADSALRDAYAHQQSVARRARGPQVPGPSRAHRELIAEAQGLLHARMPQPPRLDALARALGCSPFHLSRTFRRVTGLPLRRYAARLRARVAAQRLAEGERDLTGLALDLGYADHSHLTHAFREEWGRPPSVFRRESSRDFWRPPQARPLPGPPASRSRPRR
jgi:AraC family transcriptional regulator